jgi:predicted DCC family thiol-disulfide oxidoreductase YuxK
MFCWMLLILVLCCGVVIERTRREFESASAAATTPPVVLFDGVCNLCDMFVDLSMRFAPRDAQTGLPVLRVAALQSDVGRKLLVEQCRLDANDLSSVVLVESDGSCHRQSDAALRVIARYEAPWPLLHHAFVHLPRFVRDTVYTWVASNRYRVFGMKEKCRAPTPRDADWFLA